MANSPWDFKVLDMTEQLTLTCKMVIPHCSFDLYLIISGKLPAMQETHVESLGWENPLEKEMATHSCILAWIILWTEDLGRLQSLGHKELDMTAVTCQ